MDHTQRDHIHSVLVASEEKLVDKMNDKDDLLRRLMGELAECRTALEEQSHKLELSNMSLDASRQQAAGGARQIEEAAAHRRQMDDAQRELAARVRELEKSEAVCATSVLAVVSQFRGSRKSEAVLTTRLAGVEADRDQLSGVEIQLKGELDESRRAEKELLEKLGRAERREGSG